MKHKNLFFASIFVFLIATVSHAVQQPQLTIVFVVDQLNQQHLERLAPHLSGGLDLLLRNGIVYHNAHLPHSMPATAAGHATLSTGTLPKDHGFIRNAWYTPAGKLTNCDTDNTPTSAVFAPNGTYPYGKSAKNMMVDTLSDQLMLQDPSTHVVALSFKSRAAIALAGKMGKAIWFDNKSGNFTSSKAYFDTLPTWLTTFNDEHLVNKLKKEPWLTYRPRRWSGYHFADDNVYAHTIFGKSLIKHPELINKRFDAAPYGMFAKTPHATTLLLELAKKYLCTHTTTNCKHTVLWISISSPDKIGHMYGPDSLEYIDTLYHLDQQLYSFIRSIKRLVKYRSILFALTSDHGIEPLPELMQVQGYTSARRINAQQLLRTMNNAVRKHLNFFDQMFGHNKLVIDFKAPQFYFNQKLFNRLPEARKQRIVATLKNALYAQPGIKNVWTDQELKNLDTQPHQLEQYFKNQLYPGRSGHLFVQTEPYVSITPYKTGASHKTPYDYNTHVPLILFQKHAFESKHIYEPVTIDQVAPTLAWLWGIHKPSASKAKVLPGVLEAPCCPF